MLIMSFFAVKVIAHFERRASVVIACSLGKRRNVEMKAWPKTSYPSTEKREKLNINQNKT